MTLEERLIEYRKQLRFLQEEIQILELGLKAFNREEDFVTWMNTENRNLGGVKPANVNSAIIIIEELKKLI